MARWAWMVVSLLLLSCGPRAPEGPPVLRLDAEGVHVVAGPTPRTVRWADVKGVALEQGPEEVQPPFEGLIVFEGDEGRVLACTRFEQAPAPGSFAESEYGSLRVASADFDAAVESIARGAGLVKKSPYVWLVEESARPSPPSNERVFGLFKTLDYRLPHQGG